MHVALQLLHQEHQELRELCWDMVGLLKQRTPPADLQTAANRLRVGLLRHVGLEDEVFYPNARSLALPVQQAQGMAIEEHRIIRLLLSHLDGPASTLGFRWMVLTELVGRHLRREENEVFPAVQSNLGESEGEELASAIRIMQDALSHRTTPEATATPPPPRSGEASAWEERELADLARKRSVPLAPPRFEL